MASVAFKNRTHDEIIAAVRESIHQPPCPLQGVDGGWLLPC